jgi:phosphotriesterase-related protein
MTVRGPVDVDQIGPTLTHEHLFVDTRDRWDPSDLPDPSLGERPMAPELRTAARWSWRAFRDDLCQDPEADYDLVVEEVRAFRDAGGSCLVEMTNQGLSPAPLAMKRLAEELDLHVVAGCGVYFQARHPAWVASASVEEIEERLQRDVEEGIDGSGVRPGIIGELGTSAELHPDEERVLRAGARVARRSGLPINIHCDPPKLEVTLQILDVLEEEGHDLRRTSLSHLDEIDDPDYHEAVLRRGAIVGFDSFGHEGGYFTPTWRSLSDLAKMTTLVELVRRGYGDQLVLSQDMHRKHFLHRFGGHGYDHVLQRIVPRLRSAFELSEAQTDAMLIHTPRRLLAVAAGAGA